MEDDNKTGSIEMVPAWNADGFIFKYVPKDEPDDFDPFVYRLPLDLSGPSFDIADLTPAEDLPPPPAGDGITELGMVEPVF